MPARYYPPRDVGADPIVNAVATYEEFGGPVVVVDFGTACTFDDISANGEYLGGIIAPESACPRKLSSSARQPARVIGDSTVGSMQSGTRERIRQKPTGHSIQSFEVDITHSFSAPEGGNARGG